MLRCALQGRVRTSTTRDFSVAHQRPKCLACMRMGCLSPRSLWVESLMPSLQAACSKLASAYTLGGCAAPELRKVAHHAGTSHVQQQRVNEQMRNLCSQLLQPSHDRWHHSIELQAIDTSPADVVTLPIAVPLALHQCCPGAASCLSLCRATAGQEEQAERRSSSWQ